MTTHETKSAFEAYSPRIVTTLIFGDEKINVRSTCETSISVETDRSFPPCDAVIQMTVGDDTDDLAVRLLDGIDPTRDYQPILILSDL